MNLDFSRLIMPEYAKSHPKEFVAYVDDRHVILCGSDRDVEEDLIAAKGFGSQAARLIAAHSAVETLELAKAINRNSGFNGDFNAMVYSFNENELRGAYSGSHQCLVIRKGKIHFLTIPYTHANPDHKAFIPHEFKFNVIQDDIIIAASSGILSILREEDLKDAARKHQVAENIASSLVSKAMLPFGKLMGDVAVAVTVIQ